MLEVFDRSRLSQTLVIVGVDVASEQGDEHACLGAAPAGDGVPAATGVVADDGFGREADTVVAGGDVVECLVVETAAADPVEGGVDESEVATGVLVGEGD